ncbi:MAG: DUF1223 domain-containing protein [Alcanivoracaceae bacterium]|nr:DUF1223 domain-containing protein [Alcanivoracaceae bacterium]
MKKMSFYLLLQFSTLSFAYDFELESAEYQTQIIELFTSQGCSSCPPADRWFSTLKNQPGLWQRFIPLAYHVNYWDYIGWKDKYASPKNSIRQSLHKKVGNIRSIYTPGVIKAGQEWRYWGNQAINKSSLDVGQLKLVLKDDDLTATFNAKGKFASYNLTIALLAMDIETKVKAGENAGEDLKQDFVVLKQQTYTANKPSLQLNLDHSFFKSNHEKLAFVAWVEFELNPTPIQAVGKLL